MLNTSEWPNDAVVCSLSSVLDPAQSIPSRFFLSSKACAGILRRAEKRGKELPPLLLEALMQVAFEESALLRCSLEAQLLAELLPDALKEATAMEARIHALSNSLEALQSAYRTKANDAAWNEALTRA